MATRRDRGQSLVKIMIYVEGGGKGKKLRTECRRGFSKFFENAGLSGRMPNVVPCGPRSDAYDSFCTAVGQQKDDTVPLLLVDSEQAIANANAPWAHLKESDRWDQPSDATNDHVYLMVECMEAWFLADRDCLKKYFGPGFSENGLPGNTRVEEIGKRAVYDALKSATRRSTTKGTYKKGSHSFEILGLIDPIKVREAAPYADRLLKQLEQNERPAI